MEVLLEIRREMSLEADYDVELFAEIVRSGRSLATSTRHSLVPDSETARAEFVPAVKPAIKARKR